MSPRKLLLAALVFGCLGIVGANWAVGVSDASATSAGGSIEACPAATDDRITTLSVVALGVLLLWSGRRHRTAASLETERPRLDHPHG